MGHDRWIKREAVTQVREADRRLAPAGQSTCTRQRALKLARDHNKTYWIVDFEQ